MPRVRVIDPTGVTFNHPAVIAGLSDKQLADREHLLKKIGNNKYQVIERVQFKKGEELTIEGTVHKGQFEEIGGKKKASEETLV